MSHPRCKREHKVDFPCAACRDLFVFDEGVAQGVMRERERATKHVEAYHSGAVSLKTLIALISRPNTGE